MSTEDTQSRYELAAAVALDKDGGAQLTPEVATVKVQGWLADIEAGRIPDPFAKVDAAYRAWRTAAPRLPAWDPALVRLWEAYLVEHLAFFAMAGAPQEAIKAEADRACAGYDREYAEANRKEASA